MNTVRVGIIGGGLMGKEVASAIGRWFVLQDFPVRLELVGVADINEKTLEWFRQIPTVKTLATDYHELLRVPDIDVMYVAVPHDRHEKVYTDVLAAGKDLLAEKPFGIDLHAAVTIGLSARTSGRFVRCSSEFPFYPGPQRVNGAAKSGELGRIIEVRAGFWHGSDLDPGKPINWKRQSQFCGAAGVMNDLGIHVTHVPFRLGWKPHRVFAQLQDIVTERPDGQGMMARADVWDNAMLHTDVMIGGQEVPMRLEMKRIAPGETNTWFIEVIGMEGSIKYSTKEPKTLWSFRRDKEQVWERIDLGHQMAFPVATGAIFEAGFPDCFLQMWAAYIAERGGFLNGRFGCVTPEEAVESHKLWQAAMQSAQKKQAVDVE